MIRFSMKFSMNNCWKTFSTEKFDGKGKILPKLFFDRFPIETFYWKIFLNFLKSLNFFGWKFLCGKIIFNFFYIFQTDVIVGRIFLENNIVNIYFWWYISSKINFIIFKLFFDG